MPEPRYITASAEQAHDEKICPGKRRPWCKWKMWTSGLVLLLTMVLLLTFFSHAALAQRWAWHPEPLHESDGDSARVIDLSGSGWNLRSQNGSISIPVNVPSQQYIDLFNAGIIEDPLFAANNGNQLWVRDQNWTYSRILDQLSAPPQEATARTYLVFEGLDTFTTITLCEKPVASTQNQFRKYIFDVSEILRGCQDTPRLFLNFGPAVPITHEISKGPYQSGNVNFADGCTDDPGHELSCKAYGRKQQSDFGWDWSPSLAPAGPWRPVYAVQVNQGRVYINNALIDIYRKGQMNNLVPDQSQPWIFNASMDFTGSVPSGAGMQLTLLDASGKQILRQALGGVYSSSDTITGSTTINPELVQLWWPNAMGSQVLYSAKVDITTEQDVPYRSAALASVERRVGFRTIVLNLGEITPSQSAQGIAPGANWHFEINGKEFYAKGSNLVPMDVFWPRVDDNKVRLLFTLAKEANMNMLRVWSSGAYLDEWVYDIADEMGLLLWSEFQFTDAVYPANDVYLAEYEAEAYYNVRRLNHHPSLALWAGGNELETIELDYYFGSPIMADYTTIQEELLIKCVYANTRSISYIPSSTYNGYTKLDFESVRPQTARYKNMSIPGHYYSDTDSYNYDARGLFLLNILPVGRFADEFGFISMPSLQTWELEAPPEDLYYPSDTVVDHNRHVPFGFEAPAQKADIALEVTDVPNAGSLAGIAEMTDAVQMYLPSPNLQDSRANFSAWCYSTQIIHADAVTHQIAFYRRGSGMPERQLGSLFWQFNDVWAAPTWASVEVSGRQKLLYYTAKDIFSPVIVYPYWDDYSGDLQVWVTSDLWMAVSGTVTYQWVDYYGSPLSVGGSSTATAQATTNNHTRAETPSSSVAFTIGPINSTQVLHYNNLHTALAEKHIAPQNALLLLSVIAGTYNHSSIFHPTGLVDVALPDPELKLSRSGSTFTVTATKAVACWVWLDYDNNGVQGYWSTNGFWLNKGESKTVAFTVLNDSSGGTWADTVSVRNVYDNTQR